MLANEALKARKQLGFTQQALAAELGVTEPIVVAWEAGKMKVPRSAADDLTYRLAQKQRFDALATSGLAECAWMKDADARPVPEQLEDITKELERIEAHVKGCATCQARNAWVEEKFGPMPPRPVRGWMAVLAPVIKWVLSLPEWLQPVAGGALLFVAWSLVRALFLVPRIARDPLPGLALLAGGLGLSAALGASLGLLVSLFRQARKRWFTPRATPGS